MLNQKIQTDLSFSGGGLGLGQCLTALGGLPQDLIGGGDVKGGGGKAPDLQQNCLFVGGPGVVVSVGSGGFGVQVRLCGVPDLHGGGIGIRKGSNLVGIRGAEPLHEGDIAQLF